MKHIELMLPKNLETLVSYKTYIKDGISPPNKLQGKDCKSKLPWSNQEDYCHHKPHTIKIQKKIIAKKDILEQGHEKKLNLHQPVLRGIVEIKIQSKSLPYKKLGGLLSYIKASSLTLEYEVSTWRHLKS